MAEIKWIKIATDIFDNKKIRLIESMPEGDSIIIIWFKILVLAGTVNDDGSVYFTKDIPYTDQMLATVFDRPLNIIQLALRTFEQFGMIEIVNDIIHVSNWEKYQNVDGMDRIRQQGRERVARHREHKKLEAQNETLSNVTCNVTVTQSNAIDIEEELEEEIEKELEEIYSSEPSGPRIADPPFVKLPLNDGTEYPVTFDEVDECKRLYPAVDVEQAFRNMRGWCMGNPTKRKTKRGISKFIHTWLSKEQDRGGRPQQAAPKKPHQQMMTKDTDMSELEKRLIAN